MIHVFIIGSTELTTEREVIQQEAEKINEKCHTFRYDIQSCMNEDIPHNQDKYEAYIRDKADLIIALIGKKVGTYSIQELQLANELMLRKGKPKIKLLVNENVGEETQGIGVAHAIGFRNDFWTQYKDTNLNNKVQKLLIAARKTYIKEYRKKFFKWLIAPFAILFGIGLLCHCYIHFAKQKEVLLIAGGGTASTFFDKNIPSVNLYAYLDGYYVHMPSGDTWRLLVEEVTETTEKNTKRYIPVCISAEQYKEENLTAITKTDKFTNVGSVIEVPLGCDTLEVWVSNNLKDSIKIDSIQVEDHKVAVIKTTDLREFLQKHAKDTSINIYTTTPNSGTLHAYETALDTSQFKIDTCQTKWFDQDMNQSEHFPTGSKFMILGSQCYHVKALGGDDNVDSLLVYNDSTKEFATKGIYFYFLATGDEDELNIPKPTLRFLKKIVNEDSINSRISPQGKIKRRTTDHVKLDFNNPQDIELRNTTPTKKKNQ